MSDAKSEQDAYAAKREKEERAVEDAMSELLQLMGCPMRHANLVCSDFDVEWKRTRAVELVENAIEDDNFLTVLSGGVGLGKTTALVHYVRRRTGGGNFRYFWRRLDRGSDLYADVEEDEVWPPLFVTAARLARWRRFDEAEMAKLERAEVLAIDDIGVEFDDASGNFRSLFDALLNQRYAEELPTIISSNLPVADFAARYGARVVDRIREVGAFFEISGPSLRAPAPPPAPPPSPPPLRVVRSKKGAA